jgi:ubiquinone biosynthesis protein UbiJ
LLSNSLMAQLATLLNRGIEHDSEARRLCAELAGRSLKVQVTGLPTGSYSIWLVAGQGQVQLTTAAMNDAQAPAEATSRVAEATIIGSPIELNRLMFIDSQSPIREGHVVLEGDTDIAEKFRELLLRARPDWEAQIADRLGEPAAFQVASFVRDFRDWLFDSVDEFTERTTEYLQDDSQRVPAPDQAEEFYLEVDNLANDIERLEARIGRLFERREIKN